MGVDLEGRKHVSGIWIGDSKGEGSKFWLSVLSELKNRGVNDVLIVCCDGLNGLPDAIEAVWSQAVIQTCVVHLLRASFRYAAWDTRSKIAGALRPIYTAVSADAALEALGTFEEEWVEYLEIFHNPQRRHSALGMRTPIEYERIHYDNPTPASRLKQAGSTKPGEHQSLHQTQDGSENFIFLGVGVLGGIAFVLATWAFIRFGLDALGRQMRLGLGSFRVYAESGCDTGLSKTMESHARLPPLVVGMSQLKDI